MRCNHCQAASLVRSKSRRKGDATLGWFGFRPYRCSKCCSRMLKLRPAEVSSIVVLFGLLGCSMFGLLYYRSQVQSAHFLLDMQVDPALQAGKIRMDLRKTVKNEDVLEMIRAGASRDVVFRLINRSPAQFRVDASDIVELRKAGVPNDVIGHMLEAMNDEGPGHAPSMQNVAIPAKSPVREFTASTH